MPSADELTAGAVVVHPHEHTVMVRGSELDLTPREFEIIMKLVAHPGWVLSAEELSTDNAFTDYSPESVSVIVSRLRRKLAEAGAQDLIETVRGVGYRLHASARAGAEPLERESDLCSALFNASWRLQEAVIEAERSGTPTQRRAAIEALESALSSIRRDLSG